MLSFLLDTLGLFWLVPRPVHQTPGTSPFASWSSMAISAEVMGTNVSAGVFLVDKWIKPPPFPKKKMVLDLYNCPLGDSLISHGTEWFHRVIHAMCLDILNICKVKQMNSFYRVFPSSGCDCRSIAFVLFFLADIPVVSMSLKVRTLEQMINVVGAHS